MTRPVSITCMPAAGQLVEHLGETYETIREGRAFILVPPNTKTAVDPRSKAKADEISGKPQNVFYNPIQQFNRDLSVLAIKTFGEDFIERKRARSEKNKERNIKRSDRKRRRTAAHGEAIDGDEADVKHRKIDGAPSYPLVHDASQPAVAKPGDEASSEKTTVRDAPFQNVTTPIANVNCIQKQDFQTQAPNRPGPSFRILDALSASGLRALRYASEIPFATAIVANDMNHNATKSIARNVQHNNLSSVITTLTGDAIGHMYGVAYPASGLHGPQHVSPKYDVVDLDPYGTAAPFLDAALQATNDGGLLCVTCTDSGVFASTGYCEKTFSLYGGMPAKGPYMHEAGLRLIIHSIASTAARYGISIEPVLSLSIDFYVRVFIRIRKSPADVKFLAGKTMIVYCCDHGCGAWTTNMLGRNAKQDSKGVNIWYKHTIAQAPTADRHCEHCGSKTHIAGPMWAGPIHNGAFIEKMLDDLRSADTDIYQTTPRIEGMLTTALDELLVNEEATKYTPPAGEGKGTTAEMIPKVEPDVVDLHPFFFNPSALSKVIHCVAPGSAAFNGALRHAGYRATRSHCQAGSIKTDAPWTAIWEIMREWVRQKQPIKDGALKEGTAGYRIMQAARKNEGSADGEDTTVGADKDKTPDIITDMKETRIEASNVLPKRMNVVFDEALGKDRNSKRLVRYQQNPRENWGPMSKAKGSSNGRQAATFD